MKKAIFLLFVSFSLFNFCIAQTLEATDEVLLKSVEIAPRFPGCEDNALSEKEKNYCSDEKLIDFIGSKLKYPPEARESDIEGTVYVKFIVEKDGSLTNIEVVRDIGKGCGNEVVRVIKMMPNWIPGKEKSEPVRVQFNLPVKFKLEDSKSFKGLKKPVMENAHFPGCEDVDGLEERLACAEKMLNRFIQSNLKYPKKARKKGIEGIVIVAFTVDETGFIDNIAVVRSIGGGCDEEATRLVWKMRRWIPGKLDGKPTPVLINLPVVFKL